jgi:hypothetical protein
MSSIVQGLTTSFKAESFQGIQDLLTDSLKIALYTANADLNQNTTVYTSSGEVTGTGYTAGGVALTGATVNSSGTTAYVNFSSIQWNPAAFTTRCALIYNASKGNKSVAVLDFGSDKTATSAFTITRPANTPTAALIRSSY